jgi:hypothetical protein
MSVRTLRGPVRLPRLTRPRRLGRALGRVDVYGPAQVVTLVVGQNRGHAPKNTSGTCARKPAAFSVGRVDAVFQHLRAQQVGRDFVAATRRTGKGWYKGAPEASVAYEVAYIPPAGGGPPSEASFTAFEKHMDKLAERMARTLCQDSVLLIYDNGGRRKVGAAEWD